MNCGIVILNYKDYELTESLLGRIKDCPEIDHIVVVDNDSPNDSYVHLKRHESPKVSVIQSGRNGGYSFGNNAGVRFLIEHHHPDIIGIANPDVIFDGAFVGRIKQVFAANPDYAVLTGIQLNASGGIGSHPFWKDESTVLAMFRQVLKEIFMKTSALRDRAYLEGIRNSGQELNQVWAVEGSLFFVRREDFENAGLFDENVFLYYEEHILAYKIERYLRRKQGVVNTIAYIHNHKAPVNISRLERFRSGLRQLKIREASSGYYFRTYVTDSTFLHGVYAFLLKLRWLKTYTAYYFKRLVYRT